MPNNGVRIRLSAEGVQDVVNAFKLISTSATKENKKTTESVDSISHSLESLHSAIAAIGLEVSIGAIVEFTKKNIEAADAIFKLSEATGLSTETIQVYGLAASRAGVDQDKMTSALQRAGKFLLQLDEGGQKAKDTITQLFGNSNALKGLPDDQKLQKIVDRLGGMADGFNKAGLAQEIFGRGGSQLIPVLNQLQGKGFDAVKQSAENLGILLSDVDENNLKALRASFADLEAKSQGVSFQFLSGLAPALTRVATGISDLTIGAKGGVKDLGDLAGVVISQLGVAVVTVLSYADRLGGRIFGILNGLTDFIKSGGSTQAAVDSYRATRDLADAQATAYLAQFKKDVDGKLPTPTPPKTGRDTDVTDLSGARRAAKAALELEQASIENIRKIREANLDKEDADNKQAYETGIENLDQYYAKREEIILNKTQAEIDAATQAAAALGDFTKHPLLPDETADARQKQIDAQTTKASLAEIERAKLLTQLSTDKNRDAVSIAQKLLEYESKLGTLSGNRHDKEVADLEKEAAAYEILLRQQPGAQAGAVSAQVAAFRAAGTAKIDFNDLIQQGTAGFEELTAKRQELDNEVNSGLLFSTQANQKLLDYERQRLPYLQQIAAQALAEAKASGDTARIKEAQELVDKTQQLAVSVNTTGKAMADLKAGAEQAFGQGLNEFLSQGITQADSLGAAFANLGASIVGSMQQALASIIAVYLETKLFKILLGAATGAASGGASGGGDLSGLGGAEGGFHAAGGLITGPGGPTSDSIAAHVSAGEYIVRASAVARPGVLGLLESINRAGMTSLARRPGHFSVGGLVNGDDTTSMPGGNATLHVGLDPGIVLKEFEASPEFARVLVSTVSAKRKAFKATLGV